MQNYIVLNNSYQCMLIRLLPFTPLFMSLLQDIIDALLILATLSKFYSSQQNINISRMSFTLLFYLLFLALLPSASSWCYYGKFTHTAEVLDANYSPDRQLFVVGSTGSNHYVFNATTFIPVYQYNASTAASSATFSPNQHYIAYGLRNSTIVILNATDFSFVKDVSANFSQIQEVHFNANSDKMIACGNNGYVIYSVPGWGRLAGDQAYGDIALSCRFASNGKYATGSKDGWTRMYSATYGLLWSNQRANNAQIMSLDFSPDALWLVQTSAFNNRKVIVFDVTSNSTEQNLSSAGGSSKFAVDWNQDGSVFAYGGVSNDLDMNNGTSPNFNTLIYTFTQSNDDINSVDFSYDSDWLVVGSKNGNVLFYRRNCNSVPVSPIQSCPIEQYMNSSNSCRMCAEDMKGCRKCTNASACLACTDQYYLVSATNLCQLCSTVMPACASCSSSTTCELCVGEYYLMNGSCLGCFSANDGCLTCRNASYCVQCITESHFMNASSNLCVACTVAYPYCLNCNSSQCTRCQPSFFLNAGACSKCSLNCTSCSTTASTCTACDFGYYLSAPSCLPCLPFCSLCSAASTCLSCQLGFYLSGSSCLPCNQNCSSCITSATNCVACNAGHYLSTTSCLACTNNCLSCTDASTCLSCGLGYYQNGGSCTQCSTVSPGCLLCNSSTCWECKAGFTLVGGVCTQCTQIQNGCQLCDGSVCILCLREYYLSGNSCLPCAFPCLTCFGATSCLSCPVGYYHDGTSSCLQCSCPSCSSASTCTTCAVGQYLNLGICYDCDAVHSHCSTCSSASTCLDCLPPFYLNGANCSLCSPACTSCNGATCLSCDLGHYLQGSSCLTCLPSCSQCSSSTVCTSCIPGYYLHSNSTCQSCSSTFIGCLLCDSAGCLTCDSVSGYYLNLTQCYICSTALPNCQLCQSSSVCSFCQASYTLDPLNSSQCLPCLTFIPNCQICSNSSSCSLCLSGSYPSGTSCLSCSSGCLSCTSASVCTKCLDQFWLNGTSNCLQCGVYMVGCASCSSLTVCTDCMFGYYLSASTCVPCLSAMTGCLSCGNSSVCQSCESGYYLDPSNPLQCLTCSSNLTGCSFCRSGSSCDYCSSGYYLNNQTCDRCTDTNCLTCNLSNCLQCKSGYYLNNMGACIQCISTYTGCLFCNVTQCLSCQSGFSLIGGVCSACPDANCQICSSTVSTQCLHCNTGYFVNGTGMCQQCNSSMNGCDQCSSSAVCSTCYRGYYMLAAGSGCQLCSTSIPFCLACSSLSVCTSCSNGNLLLNNTCIFCATLIQGCAFCQVSTLCINCLQGYYLNTSSYQCQRCTSIEGCLICRDALTCQYCSSNYYLSAGTCLNCSTSMQGCVSCSSSSVCLSCEGDYTLQGSLCSIITIQQSYYPFTELKLVSKYINSSVLSHTLWHIDSKFDYVSFNLIPTTNISVLEAGGSLVNLVILSYEWADNLQSIIFYTDNPFNFDQNGNIYNKMKLFNTRLLATSNFKLDAEFQITMAETTVGAILASTATHLGNLYLAYNINSPQFIASTVGLRSYYYHYFGWFMVLVLLVAYFIKAVVLLPHNFDKGQLAPHILLTKTAVLAVFPSYAELIDYCSGFMLADFPWFNTFFGQFLANPTDLTPLPYLVFYNSLSIASTYLSVIIFLLLAAVILGLTAYLAESYRDTLANIAKFLYTFFLGGLSLAAILCIQGGFLNFSQQFTVVSSFYMLGIVIWFCMVVEAAVSCCSDVQNIFKFRIMAKTVILSLLHYNPLYLCSILAGVEALFLILQYKTAKMSRPKLWLTANILVDLALLLLILLSHSLIVIYVASLLIAVALAIQLFIFYEQAKHQKIVDDIRIGHDSPKQLKQEKQEIADKMRRQRRRKNIGNIIKTTSDQIIFSIEDNMIQKNPVNASDCNFFMVDSVYE